MEDKVKEEDLETLHNLEDSLNISIKQVNQIWSEETAKWGEKYLKHKAGYVIENGSIVALSLYGFKLSNLPEEIGKLINLRKLDLLENNLTSLTKSFTNLKSLKVIDLSWNKFNSLPEFFGNLSSLIKVNLQHNRLKTLPDSIGKLQMLKFLDLTDNPLKTLPKSIGELIGLEEIILENCHLTSLPTSIGNLKNLKNLNLSWNRLKDLPDLFKNLTNLINISLEKNQFNELPTVISELVSLQVLNLMKNKIKKLPNSIGKLKNLLKLNLQDNSLINLPDSFGKLESLKVLNLRENGLDSLPDSFGQLNLLKILDLRSNQLSWLPESFAQLKNLILLNLESNDFILIPPQLWGLESLENLIFIPQNNPLNKKDHEILERSIDEIIEYCRIRANLHIFISYKTTDFDRFRIRELAQNLENRPEIYEVIYCDRDICGNIDEFMEQNVPKCQILLFIASKDSLDSKDCQKELELAKDNNVQIVPIKTPEILWEDLAKLDLDRELGIPISVDEFEGSCDQIYSYLYKYKRDFDLFRRKEIKIEGKLDEIKHFFLDHIESEDFRLYLQKNFKTISEQFRDIEYKSKKQLKQLISLLKSYIVSD